ncbi:MAG: L,D-transpeptidase family protein [Bacteroidales bacterium]|nr:L,D-transpeptidase family protein [Bacteroidales bacterium]
MLLVFALFLFTGHEKTSPKIGESHIDFYLQETRIMIESRLKISDLNSSYGCSQIDCYLNSLVNSFYNERNYKPAWTKNFTTNGNYAILSGLLDSAGYFGFPHNFINTENLVRLYSIYQKSSHSDEIAPRVDLEIESTRELFRLLVSLHKGIVYSDSSSAFASFIKHLPVMVNHALENNKLQKVVSDIQPRLVPYKNLMAALPGFIRSCTAIDTAKPGSLPEYVLASALYYSGIIEKPCFDSLNIIDAAVLKFQRKFSLPADGILNKPTLQKMSDIMQYRYYQLCLNIDRLRKTNSNEDNYVFVNIPEFKLYLIENNAEAGIFDVIVGREETPTPVLTSRIDKIITNPHWTVPRSIVDKEMLAHIRSDSTYLLRHGYTIIDNRERIVDMAMIDWVSKNPLEGKYWIRQPQGKNNALGLVKFVFQNEHSVYLHDTPGRYLFKKEKRAFSHGCIRVKEPQKLAQLLINRYYAPDKGDVDVKTAINKGESREIKLAKPIEIHLNYITSVAGSDGKLWFIDDLYGYDETAINFLFRHQKGMPN